MRRRTIRLGAVAAAIALAIPVEAAPGIPMRIRVIKGSRQGPAAVDPRLADLQPQLSRLAYARWEEAGEQQVDMDFKKPVAVALPGGERLEVELLESRRDTVTIEVRVPAHRSISRLTLSKDKRLVQQVTPEKGGEAFFVTVRPWP
ncbi:MAG TPA: hypothetical protein VFR85_07930 [Anaeromyxobacteraceae bacterium]|nr:hypothetical protein [Anaeromyxobacteraceae bacterium]